MEDALKKIEELFGRFNVWENLTADYWAMLIAQNPAYASRKELKIRSVESGVYCEMERARGCGKYGNSTAASARNFAGAVDFADSRYALFVDKYINGFTLFTSREWMLVLSRQPRLFDFAKANGALGVLDDYAKSYISFKQPALAGKFEIGEKFEFAEYVPPQKTLLEIKFEEFAKARKADALKQFKELAASRPESATAEMWALSIEDDFSNAELCEKNSAIKNGKRSGFFAFGREHWLKVLTARNMACAAAKKYGGFGMLNSSDWRILLCSNFDFFLPLAEEFGAWGKFFAGDWHDLLAHFLKTDSQK